MRLSSILIAVGLCWPMHSAFAQDCEKPWVVVVKKDGSVVEGPLVRDINRGVVLQLEGKSTLIPEEQIEEVIQDCDRDLGARVPAPSSPGQAVPAPARKADGGSMFKNTTLEFTQRAMRFIGSGCLTLGCGLASTGLVSALGYTLNGFVQAQNNGQQTPPPQVFQLAGVFLAGFGSAAVVALGSGAGLFITAQLMDLLKSPSPSTTASAARPAQDRHAENDVENSDEGQAQTTAMAY